MDAVSTSETSVYSDITQRNNPEGSNLHSRSRENLTFHRIYCIIFSNIASVNKFYPSVKRRGIP